MKKKTISDILNVSDIEDNKSILIEAGTGTGKSYFIKNSLYDLAKKNNKKILYLLNRKITKEQFYNTLNIEDKTDNTILLMTYQTIEMMMINTDANNLKELLEYDYLICDEFHYWFDDAQFNKNTDLSMLFARKFNNTKIFMSATASDYTKAMVNYLGFNFDKEVIVEPNYDFINKLAFYQNDATITEIINDTLNKGQKVIVFMQSAKKCYDLYSLYSNKAMFLCSEGNDKYFNKVNPIKRNYLFQNQRFEDDILFTTATIDTGFNIVDPDISTIIIDFTDKNSIIQALGRKRRASNELMDIYIKNKSKHVILAIERSCRGRLERAGYLMSKGYEAYLKKYFKNPDKSLMVYSNFKGKLLVNKCFYVKDMATINMCKAINKTSFAKFISKLFGKRFRKDMILEKKNDIDEIELYLSNRENEIMLNSKDRKELIETFNIRSDKNNRLLKGLDILNNALEEYDSDFRIIKVRITKMIDGKRKDYRNAWKIIRISEEL